MLRRIKFFFFFSSRRRHTRSTRDWSSDVCSSDLVIDVAKALIGDRKIEIQIVGVRPGEKVHEILISEEEVFRTMQRDDYYVIRPILPELSGPLTPVRTTEYSSGDVTLDVAGIRLLLASAGIGETLVAGAPA